MFSRKPGVAFYFIYENMMAGRRNRFCMCIEAENLSFCQVGNCAHGKTAVGGGARLPWGHSQRKIKPRPKL
jgi:hypothetical protein